MRLIDYDGSRNNNFNLIRFISALLVLYSHHFALTNTHINVEPFSSVGMTLSSIAVDVFFITSGLLITASYYASTSVLTFTRARILRIYPALIVCVLFCILVVGTIYTTLPLSEYFSDPQTFKFLKRNSLLINDITYNLPGVFSENYVKNAINGSLWTLPYEVKMYVILPFILIFLRFVSRKLNINWLVRYSVLALTITSIILNIINQYNDTTDHFIRLFSLFFTGASFYLWRDKVHLSGKISCLCFLALIFAYFSQKHFLLIYSFCIPYILLVAAYTPAGLIRKFNNIGDYSYGIYIYAFPVQQSLVAIKPELSITTIFLLSFLITVLLAMMSWHFVERPFLKFKKIQLN